MTNCDVHITGDRQRFFIGETLTGSLNITVPDFVPLSNVNFSFHCVGEVKWSEPLYTPYYINNIEYYNKYSYLEKELPIDTKLDVIPKNKPTSIPFTFAIPKDIRATLPSTMISNHGSIKYFFKVVIRVGEEVKTFLKEVIIESPIVENLMITVGSTAEKNVLLHKGKVSMHASIGRKGFAPGETMAVHIAVNNGTGVPVKPRISLHQVQIYMCDSRHKTVETTLPEDEPVLGTEVGPHSEATEVLNVKVPANEALTIKSSVITVKYFVHVTLDIPQAIDLHINLPVVITSAAILNELIKKEENRRAETTNLIN